MLDDLRLAWRRIRHSPGYSSAVMLLLAVGLGVNFTVFSLVSAVLLRPLPVIGDPRTLAVVGRSYPGNEFDNMSYANYVDYRDRNVSFTELAAHDNDYFGFSADGLSERLHGTYVTTNYFRALGVEMAAGRAFLDAEGEMPPRESVVILSYSLWERRWNLDPGVVGKQVFLSGRPFTVVGVTPKGFQGARLDTRSELFTPFAARLALTPGSEAMFRRRDASWLTLVGRVKPGRTVQRAQADLNLIASQLDREHSENKGQGATVSSYHPLIGPDALREASQFLSMFLVATLLVLLVVCANATNLFLARASGRNQEAATRLALGCTRWRLSRLVLAEGLLLATGGLGSGALVALWAQQTLALSLPLEEYGMSPIELSFDARLALWSVAVAAAVGVLLSALPAWHLSGTKLMASLKAGQATSSQGRDWARSMLTVAQVALCVVLVTAGRFLMHTVDRFSSIEERLGAESVLTVSLDPGLNGYDEGQGRQLFDQLLVIVRGLPAVENAALAARPILSGGGMSVGRVSGGVIEREGLTNDCNFVTPGYLRTMQIPLLRGRDFTDGDSDGSARVVILNQTLAARLFPDRDPVGESVRIGDDPKNTWEVVGVAADTRYRFLTEEPRNYYYAPFAQMYRARATLHLRTNQRPETLVKSVREVVAGLDPHLPVYDIRTLADQKDLSLWPQRFASAIIGLCGVITLGLAGLGLYATLTHAVARRRREIGIRAALGASRGDILTTTFKAGAVLAGVGLAIGLGLSHVFVKLVSSVLYDVAPAGIITYATSAALVVAVTLGATYFPARHASRIDPMAALRYE